MNLFERIEKLERGLIDSKARTALPDFATGGVLFGKSTGIITSDATNLFWDNTNKRLGIGTNTPSARLTLNGTNASYAAGPHIETLTASDAYPLAQLLSFQHDNINLSFDAYYDGSWRSSDAGSNFQIRKLGDLISFYGENGVSAGSVLTWRELWRFNPAGSFANFVTSAGTTSPGVNGQLYSRSTATPDVGFGGDYQFLIDSATVADRLTYLLRNAWATATDASRKARATWFIYDTAARDVMRHEASGSAAMIGFLGAAAVIRQNITGVRTGTLAQLQAVMLNLLTGLANLGLVTNSTT